MKINSQISEQYIINKFLKKLNLKKKETYNFKNDAAFIKNPLGNIFTKSKIFDITSYY